MRINERGLYGALLLGFISLVGTLFPNSTEAVDYAGWSANYDVSKDEGLVLRDVSYMGHRIISRFSVPYFYLRDGYVCQLGGNVQQTVCPSTMRGAPSVLLLPDKLVIEATYIVNLLPQGGTLHVTQRYELHSAGEGCEPSSTLKCARFKPLVKYQFYNVSDPYIKTVQRLQFSLEQNVNKVAIFHDCEGDQLPQHICFPNATLPLGMNPLGSEGWFPLIRNGNSVVADDYGVTADNIHQTYNPHVTQPGLNRMEDMLKTYQWAVPGCSECVHIHWRWGYPTSIASKSPFNDAVGRPMIPPGSNQDVDLYVVNDQDVVPPQGIIPLVNGEALTRTPVMYYVSTGHQHMDTFFFHGGFLTFEPAQDSSTPAAPSNLRVQ